jgi:thiamine pyrophosphate-dependent acetolactate synthase large subunit-like protein
VVKRLDCLDALASMMSGDTVTVTSVSRNARMWPYVRKEKLCFYGLNMGLCTPVALGMSIAQPNLKIVAIESDGSLLLDVGVLMVAANLKPPNLVILVLDNETYGDYGPTATADTASLESLAIASGISNSITVKDMKRFKEALQEALQFRNLSLIVAKIEHDEIDVGQEYKSKDGRPNKEEFVSELKKRSMISFD